MNDEDVAPVTILDGSGRVVRIIPAEEFRRAHGVPERPKAGSWRLKRGRGKTSEIAESDTEDAVPV